MMIVVIFVYIREIDGFKLFQVYVFNCLKEIYKNVFLVLMGNKFEKYLFQCLELVVNGFKLEVWVICNCGLIFFWSLIDSFFGSQESKVMIEVGWDGKVNCILYY